MVIGIAPPFALIVENAARIKREIAADRAHVAVGRAGDMGRGLRYGRIMLPHVGMRRNLAERGSGADLEPMRIGFDAAQLGDTVDVDQNRRRDDAAPDVHHEIGTAANEPAVAMGGARRDQFRKRPRPDQIELRQRVHYEIASPSPAGRGSARSAGVGPNFPTWSPAATGPPPAGEGKARRACFSSAANTRSGVTGRSLKRNPVASAMALVSAGRNAASEPSPASLAPNGPCGSMLSTMPTSIGGESWIVGTR